MIVRLACFEIVSEIFEYLFDIDYLGIFLSLNFEKSLHVLLNCFSQTIYDILNHMNNEGKLITIRLDKFGETGILSEIIDKTNEKDNLVD